MAAALTDDGQQPIDDGQTPWRWFRAAALFTRYDAQTNESRDVNADDDDVNIVVVVVVVVAALRRFSFAISGSPPTAPGRKGN